MNWFDRFLEINPTWRDAVDIVIVAFIIYYILRLIRGTRAMQITIGLMLLGSTTLIANAFDLPALEVISRQILFYLPFAVIILFQQEIRRGLAHMVGDPIAKLFRPRMNSVPYDAILNACEVLAAKKTGALVAIEGRQTLRMYEDGAKPVDALVTTELLVSIFTPGGPLHDGAVLIRANRIVAANAFLPLTTTPDPTLAHGTRHRAAIGLSEETDAMVIVVSEENGSMAVALDGVLREDVSRDQLAQILRERFA
ncbi:MAG TPA: diadenylate cyclase CdaA [Thermoanaerobaculia bacterium]|jgi:diadenylate cyclase|nr:diadenylate cyclase CdaA [Thermoanaerobaculia bacterium]